MIETISKEDAHQLREIAWDAFYKNHHLSIVHWAELAANLNQIIDDVTGLEENF